MKLRRDLQTRLQGLQWRPREIRWSVVRLDRIGRTQQQVLDIIALLGERGVNFHSVGEALEVSSREGGSLWSNISAIAAFTEKPADVAPARSKASAFGRASVGESCWEAQPSPRSSRSICSVSGSLPATIDLRAVWLLCAWSP
jgi:hypothetical protein